MMAVVRMFVLLWLLMAIPVGIASARAFFRGRG
jgi:hypothetical protein